MKYIIFISDNIRHGNFPRLDGFSHNSEYDKYLYSGRELTVREFNDAAKRIFSPDFNSQGFTLRPQVVSAELDAIIAKEEADAAEAKRIINEAAGKKWLADLAAQEAAAAPEAPIDEPAVEVDEPEAPEAPETPELYFEGRQIFLGGERVAGLFGEDAQLRVRAEHNELRPAIEAWLESQPTP